MNFHKLGEINKDQATTSPWINYIGTKFISTCTLMGVEGGLPINSVYRHVAAHMIVDGTWESLFEREVKFINPHWLVSNFLESLIMHYVGELTDLDELEDYSFVIAHVAGHCIVDFFVGLFLNQFWSESKAKEA